MDARDNSMDPQVRKFEAANPGVIADLKARHGDVSLVTTAGGKQFIIIMPSREAFAAFIKAVRTDPQPGMEGLAYKSVVFPDRRALRDIFAAQAGLAQTLADEISKLAGSMHEAITEAFGSFDIIPGDDPSDEVKMFEAANPGKLEYLARSRALGVTLLTLDTDEQFVLTPAKRGAYSLFLKTVKTDTYVAMESLVLDSVIFPETDTLRTRLGQLPGLVMVLGEKAMEAAGAAREATTKKL